MEQAHGLFGNFTSWAEAMEYNYDDDPMAFLEKVKSAILQVKAGKAAFERDSVLFDRIERPEPLIDYLLTIAEASGNKLNVLDFGGSLGSTYFQCRSYLEHVSDVSWSVVEQQHYVTCGQEFIQDETLRFYYTVEECRAATEPNPPNVLILSGVLLCLEDPHAFMAGLLQHAFDYVIVDRTPFLPHEDRLTIYIIPPQIHRKIVPTWVISEERFLSHFAGTYERLDEFDAFESYPLEDGLVARSKGFLFRRLNPAADEGESQ